jgi:hypothetical protein
MNSFVWIQHYPLEALPYEIGFVLLAFSMIWYGLILKKLGRLTSERPIWIFPLIGAGFILASAVMHSVAYVVFLPRMDDLRSLEEISRFSTFMLQWRSGSLAGILIGGIFSLLGGSIYYRSTTR